MINVLIDETKKIIGFYGTNIEMKKVEDIPELPTPKIGCDFIPYYDEKMEKIIYKEVKRDLTDRELYEQLAARQEATAQAVQEIALNSLGGL